MPIPQLLNIYANNIQHYVLKLCKNMKKNPIKGSEM